MSKTTSTKIVKAAPDQPALLKEFDGVRQRVTTILNLGRRVGHESILLGLELNRLKLELGTKHGGDRKSAGSSSQVANLIPWTELVEQQTGLSYDSCQRCMKLATAAKKHIKVLTAADVLKSPLNALPEARQAVVVKALEKAADGRSLSELMHAFGAWKEKKSPSPPKSTKESAAKRIANQADETLQQQQLIDLSEDHMITVEDIKNAEAFKALDIDRLAHFENLATALLEAISTELKDRRKAKP